MNTSVKRQWTLDSFSLTLTRQNRLSGSKENYYREDSSENISTISESASIKIKNICWKSKETQKSKDLIAYFSKKYRELPKDQDHLSPGKELILIIWK